MKTIDLAKQLYPALSKQDFIFKSQEYSHFFKWEMNWGSTKYKYNIIIKLERIYPQCNTKHDRDNNAAINILNQGLKELGLTA